MCENSKIISRVKNGEISICKNCETYTLTFNNIFFQFTADQLQKFTTYVFEVDIDYWLEYNSYSTQKRKVPIPTSHQNLILIFDVNEVLELRTLLKINKKKKIFTAADIDYPLILN